MGFVKSNTARESEVHGFMIILFVVNVMKTDEMTIDFNKKGIIVPPHSNINGVVVVRVTTYLGVEIDNKHLMNVHKICPKACKRGCFF